MNERHVTSLETSKKLKEAGFPQDTEFIRMTDKLDPDIDMLLENSRVQITGNINIEYYTAPLSIEILEKLAYKEIMDYCNDKEIMAQGGLIGLFRSPDKLAEIWLEVKGK